MQVHRVAPHLQLDRERQLAVDLGAVMHVLEAPHAVGDRGDAGAHLALGVVEQGRAGGQHRPGAVLGRERLHARDAQPVRRHLRAQVGQPFARHLAVQQDQLLDVLLQLAFAVEPDRRDAQPLLVDVRMAAIGEVGVVREVHRPGDDAPLDEDRLGQHDVGQVRPAALVGVVADEHVARAHLLDRMALQDALDHADEAAEMDRDVLGLAERAALDVEQRGRAVAPFLDVGGVGGAHQRLAHLLDDRGERGADHLHGDRVHLRPGEIEREVHGAASRIRLS